MQRFSQGSLRLATACAVVILVLGATAVSQQLAATPDRNFTSKQQISESKTDPTARTRLTKSYGKLPISFEANRGQVSGAVQFLAHGLGYTIFLTPGEAVLAMDSPKAQATTRARRALQSATAPRLDVPQQHPAHSPFSGPAGIVRLQLIGSNAAAEADGLEPLLGHSNYFIGNDPAKWHTDVPTFARVRYHNVYPGIDLDYYGNQEGRIEHDFVVTPGADPGAISFELRDEYRAAVSRDGALVMPTPSGNLTLCIPVAYQIINGRRKEIAARYEISANNRIRFKLADYERAKPLVIDPVLVYSGRFGGSGDDVGVAIAVDSAGNAYITGQTSSPGFPLVNAFQKTKSEDVVAFVAKINAAGSALVYSTYLGCNVASPPGFTFGDGIAVDNSGRAYVTGGTPGAGFPVKNAHQPTTGGGSDAFLTVFSPAGNSLVYSTYLGGPGDDFAVGITLDAKANVYITGASGVDFPTLQSVQGTGDIFVAKFNSAGVLQYSSILTEASAVSSGIAVDSSGSAYVTGITGSTTYPTVKPAFQNTCRACPSPNGFVTKLSPSGEKLVYSTYLGGTEMSGGYAIAVDTSGQAYIGGIAAAGFPVTAGAFQKAFGGGEFDGYVAKLNTTGSGLVYSTYLGGSGDDWLYGIALDQYRHVYITGQTTSPNFPQKAPIQGFLGTGSTQLYVTTLSNTGSSISYYSTYFGQNSSQQTGGIAVDKALDVYLTGATLPGGVPITPGAVNIVGGGSDVFLSKFVIMDDISLALSGSPTTIAHGAQLTYTIAVTSKGPDFGVNVVVDDTLPTGTTFVSHTASGGSCTAPAVGVTGKLHCVLSQLNKGSTYIVTMTVKVNAAAGTTLSNTATAASNMQDFVPSNNKGTLTTKVN
jgi:uncharacterized repeat protein (TIGR01451 family)